MNIFRYFVEITLFNHLNFFYQLIHSYFTANIWFFSHVHVWFWITCVKDRMDVSCNILVFLKIVFRWSFRWKNSHSIPYVSISELTLNWRIMQLIEIQIPVQGHEQLDMELSLMLCWEEYTTSTVLTYFLKTTMATVCTRTTPQKEINTLCDRIAFLWLRFWTSDAIICPWYPNQDCSDISSAILYLSNVIVIVKKYRNNKLV